MFCDTGFVQNPAKCSLFQNYKSKMIFFSINRYLKQDLLELCPVIVGVANDHGLQLIWLEQLKNFSAAHLVEACVKALKQRGH